MSDMGNSNIYPVAFNDISSWKLFDKGNHMSYCVGSIEKDKFIEVREESLKGLMLAIGYFNGAYTITEIERILERQHQMKINIENLYNILCKAGLIEGGDKSLIEKQEMDSFSYKIAEINIKKMYRMFEKITRVFFPVGLALSLVVIAISLFHLKSIQYLLINPNSYQIKGSYALGICFAIGSFVGSILLHEISHAVMGYKYGLVPSKMVISLYLGFTPMIYLKIPGIYTIKPRKRVAIWAAGMYTNLLLSAIFIIIYDSMNFSSPLHTLFGLLVVTNLSLVVMNASPLLPLDGYFIVSTLLKKANLRKSSFKEFKKWIFREKNNFRGLYIIYFLLSNAFVVFIFGTQVYWITKKISHSIESGESITDILMDFKVIFLIILVILLKKVFEVIIKRAKLKPGKSMGVK